MSRQPPISTRTDTLCPYTALCRSTEAVGGGADHAGDLDRNLLTPNLGKRVVRAGVVVERCSTAIGREVIGAEPVLPNDDRVTGNRTHLFHEAREMEGDLRSEEHTSELQSLMRISYAVFCLKKKK